MGWKGLLFEVDPFEYSILEENRPNSQVVLGPVCPSTLNNVTILLSKVRGWTGSNEHYDLSRLAQKERQRESRTFICHHLAKELRKRSMHRVDYMTIDTEGSEPALVKDFPWNDFDVRVVQIEQLVAASFPAQTGKKESIIHHMTSVGYKLLSVYPVARNNTDDLIFTRNLDEFLPLRTHEYDGQWV